MKKLNAAGWSWLCLYAIFFFIGMDSWRLYAQTASPELIVDICSTPHKYWNKYVMLKGHVRSVTANPPGTNRGSYVLRDSSDTDITVLTSDLPAQGKDYTVSGNVEQTSPDSKVPVIREFRRTSGSEPEPRQAARPRRAAPTEEVEPAPAPAPAPSRRREATQPAAEPPAAQQPAPAAPAVVIPPAQPAESSGMSTPLILGIVGLAALIVIAIVVVAMRPKKAAPAPPAYGTRVATASAPSPIRPPAPPPPTVGRTVSAAPKPAAATQVMPPPAAKGTEVYFDLGMDLVVTDGPDKGKRFPITKPAITLGRTGGSRQNDVTLADGTVSREHAKILYAAAEKTFRLINESTTNPARLNGNPIDAVVIKDGDSIQIGATILKFSKRG